MNRDTRARIANETLAMLQSGIYTTAGQVQSIHAELDDACAGTTLYGPEAYADLMRQLAALPAENTTLITVNNRTTLGAARVLADSFANLGCLNFASAKNPGGGFLSGSQAQEESLARDSGLYATLQTQPDFYAFHRQQETCLYSDRVIFSPGVPVFRDDNGQLLSPPWKTSFLTAAAVNAGAVRRNEPENIAHINPVMQRRARMVLAVAALRGCEALVLGAWGCGVFQNEPDEIAKIFAEALSEPLFEKRFAHVEFAVYDPAPEQAVFNAFQRDLTL